MLTGLFVFLYCVFSGVLVLVGMTDFGSKVFSTVVMSFWLFGPVGNLLLEVSLSSFVVCFVEIAICSVLVFHELRTHRRRWRVVVALCIAWILFGLYPFVIGIVDGG